MSNHNQAIPQVPARGLSGLRPKMKLLGRVQKVELFGAVVDIGASKPALLHISQMGGEPTKPAKNKVSAGEEITVWVHKVTSQSGRIDLTLIEPIAVEWHEINLGQVREGKIIRLEKFGAFVDIGAERTGLVHLRELTTGQVRHPSEVVSIGEKVEVKVIAVDRKKKRIDLSMRALEVEPVEDGNDELPTMTSLEAALRAAMDDENKTRRPKRKREKATQGSASREALLRRTLTQHHED